MIFIMISSDRMKMWRFSSCRRQWSCWGCHSQLLRAWRMPEENNTSFGTHSPCLSLVSDWRDLVYKSLNWNQGCSQKNFWQGVENLGVALNLIVFSYGLGFLGFVVRGGSVVNMLDCQSRGSGFKSWPGQKFGSTFLLHLCPLANSAMMSTLAVQCQHLGSWDDEGEDWPPTLICQG